MALPEAVQGALRPSVSLTWVDADDAVLDLTNATVTGSIQSMATGIVRAIAGSLTVTSAVGGVFSWSYAAGDVVEAGDFLVQFTATYSVGVTPARSRADTWRVHAALGG